MPTEIHYQIKVAFSQQSVCKWLIGQGDHDDRNYCHWLWFYSWLLKKMLGKKIVNSKVLLFEIDDLLFKNWLFTKSTQSFKVNQSYQTAIFASSSLSFWQAMQSLESVLETLCTWDNLYLRLLWLELFLKWMSLDDWSSMSSSSTQCANYTIFGPGYRIARIYVQFIQHLVQGTVLLEYIYI